MWGQDAQGQSQGMSLSDQPLMGLSPAPSLQSQAILGQPNRAATGSVFGWGYEVRDAITQNLLRSQSPFHSTERAGGRGALCFPCDET